MAQDDKDKKESKRGFWSRLMDSLDKKMEARAKAGSCCCSGTAGQSKDKKC